ncbi:MAG TPA: hypothetical protein VF293_02300 [Candidatus Limnocylindrales bacterium]|jgi:hypothetical protein
MLHDSIRVMAFAFGMILCLSGLVVMSVGWPDAASGVFATLLGAGLMILAILQRNRYRSEVAEKAGLNPGPGGGENDWLEPRFQPTGELFTDPTSGRVMRVWVDRGTGQRRYRAEG